MHFHSGTLLTHATPCLPSLPSLPVFHPFLLSLPSSAKAIPCWVVEERQQRVCPPLRVVVQRWRSRGRGGNFPCKRLIEHAERVGRAEACIGNSGYASARARRDKGHNNVCVCLCVSVCVCACVCVGGVHRNGTLKPQHEPAARPHCHSHTHT